MNIAEIRAKYPQYNGVPDGELVRGLYRTYYKDKLPYPDFLRSIDFRDGVDPTADMGQLERFNAGVGKAFVDVGRGAAQMVGAGPSAAQTADQKVLDAPLLKTGAGLAGNVTGAVGALAPLALVPGANTVAGAGAIGSAMAALSPTESAGERIKNMVLGGTLGGGVQAATHIPKAIEVARTAGRAIVEPLSAEGRDQIIGRALNKATGGQEKDVIARLQAAREIVPGSAPTAGQAAGNAGIAAIERTATATNPVVMELSRQRMAAQNTARTGLLDDLSGTGGERMFHADARDATAKKLYDEAYAKGVDLARDATTGHFLPKASVTARKGEITKLMSTPSMQDAATQARRLMADDPNLKGKLLDPAGSVQGLDYTRRALSDMIGKAQGNEQRILINLRERLDTTLNKISPKYAEARETFSKMSQPINAMDVAKAISDKARRPLDDQVMPNAFARAFSDDTAASATGFGKATLDSTLTPRKHHALEAIKEDLARAEFAKNAGRGAGSDTVQKLAMTSLLEGTGISKIPQLLTGTVGKPISWAANKVYGNADKQAAERLAEALLSPKETAAIMSKVPSEAQQMLIEALARQKLGATQQRLGVAGRAVALPLMAQELSQ